MIIIVVIMIIMVAIMIIMDEIMITSIEAWCNPNIPCDLFSPPS